MKNQKNTRLVYASDGSHKKKPLKSSKEVVPAEVEAKIRVEKKGRGGKSVSVIFNLPENPDYFAKLAKKLKSQCGTGGTFKDGQIEIQGDHREKLKSLLEKQGFRVKLAGG